MKALAASSSDSLIARETASLFCAIRFDANRKKNFEAVLRMCRRASVFIEDDGMYLVAFQKTKEDTRLVSVITSELHSASWRYTLFANGRVQKNKWAFLNTLDCMVVASKCKDPRAHCHMIIDDPFGETLRAAKLKISLDKSEDADSEQWVLPCQQLDGFVKFDRRLKADPAAQLDAAAVKRNVHTCPFFDPTEFKRLKTLGSKPKVKRYW